MGGSTPQYTTTTTTNTPFNAAQISTVQNKAIDLLNNNPLTAYPGSTYVQPTSYQTTGYGDVGSLGLNAGEASGGNLSSLQTGAMSNDASLAAGGGNAFAMPYLNNLAGYGSTNPASSSIDALMGVPNGTAGQSLAATASGAFLNANPYLNAQFAAATDPVVRQYMAATAPQTSSAMNAAGRFGSGALANAENNNQLALGDTLGNVSANLYGNAYNNERNLMNQAATSLGNLQDTSYGTAGSLGVQGQNSAIASNQTALNAWKNLLQNQQQAINAAPTLSGMTWADLQAAINGGQGLQQLGQADLNSQIAQFMAQQQAPWATLGQAASIVGGGIPGTSVSNQPYFSPSPFSQVLTGATQGLGLGNALLGSGGILGK